MSANWGRMSIVASIFIFLACNIQCANGLRILGIFPLNGRSHFVVPERIMKGLAERGHQVDVYTHFPQKKSIPNYKDFSLAGTLPGATNNLTYDFLKIFGTMNMEMLIGSFGNPACEVMSAPVFKDLFEKLKKKQPYDVVIIEPFASNCYLAWGRHLNIPMVAIMASNILDWWNEPLGNPVNLAATPSVFSAFFNPMTFWERLTNTLMYYTVLAQYKYHIQSQNKYVEKYFGDGYPDATELTKDVDLMLLNDHHSVSGIRSFTPAIIPLAGVHIVDDGTKLPTDVQNWLNESEDGCIYVSFGSMVRLETFPMEVVDAFYATFRNIAPVRVLFKIAKPEELPPGLPSNVLTQSWFSQIQVLKHKNMKAFVTHGGLMSTLESIYAGVPMVGIPLFGDQPINVKTQVRRKIATSVDLKELNERTLTSAIKTILKDATYKKNVEKLSKEMTDRPMDPMDTAAYWVEYIVRHGKKTLRSPVVDMPWWQANLIDVYALIVLILLTVYFILKMSFRGVVMFCCPATKKTLPKKEKKN